MKKWIGIAAVLIVLLGTGLFFMQGEPEKTASSNSDSETAAPEKPDYVRELAENMTLEEKVPVFQIALSAGKISLLTAWAATSFSPIFLKFGLRNR